MTEFDGHTSVAMDAELLFWLHDVVTSYVREKDTQKGKYLCFLISIGECSSLSSETIIYPTSPIAVCLDGGYKKKATDKKGEAVCSV